MLCGVLESVALAPDVMDRLITAKDTGDVGFSGGVRVIKISARERERFPGSVRLELKPDGKADVFTRSDDYAPQSLAFEFPGIEGSVKFSEWKLNARPRTACSSRPRIFLYARWTRVFFTRCFRRR